jgi:hypothetical protein
MYQFTIVILIETASLVLIHVNKNENCEKPSNFLMIVLKISYFHMSSAVRSLFRYEAEIWSTRRQSSAQNRPNTWKLTAHEFLLNNIFRVYLSKVLKNNKFIINLEVIFDRCQVRYITGKVYTRCFWNTCVNFNQWKNSPTHETFLYNIL